MIPYIIGILYIDIAPDNEDISEGITYSEAMHCIIIILSLYKFQSRAYTCKKCCWTLYILLFFLEGWTSKSNCLHDANPTPDCSVLHVLVYLYWRMLCSLSILDLSASTTNALQLPQDHADPAGNPIKENKRLRVGGSWCTYLYPEDILSCQ